MKVQTTILPIDCDFSLSAIFSWFIKSQRFALQLRYFKFFLNVPAFHFIYRLLLVFSTIASVIRSLKKRWPLRPNWNEGNFSRKGYTRISSNEVCNCNHRLWWNHGIPLSFLGTSSEGTSLLKVWSISWHRDLLTITKSEGHCTSLEECVAFLKWTKAPSFNSALIIIRRRTNNYMANHSSHFLPSLPINIKTLFLSVPVVPNHWLVNSLWRHFFFVLFLLCNFLLPPA